MIRSSKVYFYEEISFSKRVSRKCLDRYYRAVEAAKVQRPSSSGKYKNLAVFFSSQRDSLQKASKEKNTISEPFLKVTSYIHDKT